MTTKEILRDEILKRLRVAYPTSPPESLMSMAHGLIEVGAYNFDGSRLVPIGNRVAMTRAAQIAPSLARQITSEHVKACSSQSSESAAPVDRVAARLQAMGIDFDAAINRDGGDESWVDDYDLSPKGAA
ncbi:MAG TPA: hypothetical protein VJN18_25130 [Polyangiaceae bacterium]|nr:hypothetical protein [Polyangiaceae bacterium]